MTSIAELLPKAKKLAFELQGQVRQVSNRPHPAPSCFALLIKRWMLIMDDDCTSAGRIRLCLSR